MRKVAQRTLLTRETAYEDDGLYPAYLSGL